MIASSNIQADKLIMTIVRVYQTYLPGTDLQQPVDLVFFVEARHIAVPWPSFQEVRACYVTPSLPAVLRTTIWYYFHSFIEKLGKWYCIVLLIYTGVPKGPAAFWGMVKKFQLSAFFANNHHYNLLNAA